MTRKIGGIIRGYDKTAKMVSSLEPGVGGIGLLIVLVWFCVGPVLLAFLYPCGAELSPLRSVVRCPTFTLLPTINFPIPLNYLFFHIFGSIAGPPINSVFSSWEP